MAPAANRGQEPTPPLVGVRALDLIVGPGAYGPKLLAALGAEVVRVEPPGGAGHRRRPPLYVASAAGADSLSLYYLHYNAGKRGLTLDLDRDEGRALLRRLLATVDVVFDNGALARLGMQPEALAEATPLTVVSVTPFGLRGARAGWQGGDLVCQAMSGMIGLYGYYDERPARIGPEQASELGGLAAALAALIALYGRRRDGRGEFIDIALEQVAALVTLQMSNASVFHQYGFARSRATRTEGYRGVIYQAKDGYVAMSAYRRPDGLRALLAEAGLADTVPGLRAGMTEPQMAALPGIEETVQRLAAGMTRAELVERAQAHGMLGLPVSDAADLLADPFLQRRAFFVQVPHPELGMPLTDAGPPIRFGATPLRLDRRPPLLGEHTAEEMARIGVGADELARLRQEGVV